MHHSAPSAVRCLLSALALLAVASVGTGHPVPRLSHDRTIEVHLTPTAVGVKYRLEVDPFTVVYSDLPAVKTKEELTAFRGPRQYFDAFTRSYAPILADNLTAELDGRPLTFKCRQHGHEELDHLRCDFVLEAEWTPTPGQTHRFRFQEGNYELEAGQIRLSLTADPGIETLQVEQPDEALRARPAFDLRPGDEARLRRASASFRIGSEGPDQKADIPRSPGDPRSDAPSADRNLLVNLLDSPHGFWALMALAAMFGAAHALTPGHGKTLVASYLVGEQGTVWHALLLGVVTTLTHTGVVLAIAAALPFLFPRAVPADIQAALGFFGGLLIAGIGVWLLLRRLSGGPDHIHIGGHGHHHHHGFGHGEHHHGSDGHTHALSSSERIGWWSLVGLGISGGLVPCWDAILMLGMAIAAQRLWLGLPLLLAFSAGLAGVLVAVGVAVVYLKGFAGSHWGESRLFRALPVLSAVVVTSLGLWLCYDSIHPQSPSAPAAAQSSH